jgi:hypothetical protein
VSQIDWLNDIKKLATHKILYNRMANGDHHVAMPWRGKRFHLLLHTDRVENKELGTHSGSIFSKRRTNAHRNFLLVVSSLPNGHCGTGTHAGVRSSPAGGGRTAWQRCQRFSLADDWAHAQARSKR